MRWSKPKNDKGKEIPYVLVSEEPIGYRIARYVDEGVSSYRASRNGQFLPGEPSASQADAKRKCANHYAIMGDK